MPEPIETNELMTSTEVARLFRVGRPTVIGWVDRGVLDAVTTPGGRYRFRTSDVRALLASRDEFGNVPQEVQSPAPQLPSSPGTASGTAAG